MTTRGRALVAWVPALAWAVTIFFLSSQPALPSPMGASDKQAHAVAYGILATVCLVGLTGARIDAIRPGRVVVAFVLAVLYGVSDEWHQSFVPGRSPEVADVIADATGALLALGLVWASAILLARWRGSARTGP